MSTIVTGYHALPETARGGVAALGNFDGVHRGHAAVLKSARALAAKLGVPPVAAVFKPHPRRYFQPDTAPFRLMSDDQRARALGEAGAVRLQRSDPLVAVLARDLYQEEPAGAEERGSATGDLPAPAEAVVAGAGGRVRDHESEFAPQPLQRVPLGGVPRRVGIGDGEPDG